MSQATTWGVPRNSAESGLPYEMEDLATRADEALDASLSAHSGTTAPAYAVAGTTWLDTSGSLYALKLYDGTAWGTLGSIDPADGTWIPADASIGIDQLTDALLVTEADTLASNDNDTTVPTTAAILDHLDSNGIVAWVAFNGTGTPSITGQKNVAAISDNGTGDYTIHFTNALPSSVYAAAGMANNAVVDLFTRLSTAIRINVKDYNNVVADRNAIMVIVVQ